MTQTITVDTKTIEKILSRLDELRSDINELKNKLLKEAPYGSNEWWKKEEKKATEDIKKGRYKVFSKTEDLINDLHKSLE